ncbi:hypothetical protein C8J57DRAFT_320041 [Mycena rebaudengoi]|nr:hypothetical protein C8J57DRAFT_320041 [Mycena rebaudengoi]
MKEFLLVLLASLALATSSQQPLVTESTAPDCTVLAWVRAEDLAPNRISHGELRIKVEQPQCAAKVASVALRLQLREFSEVKYLREGVVLPAIPLPDSQTIPEIGRVPWIPIITSAVNAMGDPSLWVIKAEERQVWSTEAVLIDDNPDFSHPIITPFIVASPAVNYPEVYDSWGHVSPQEIPGHSDSELGYLYVALVTFTDGRTAEVPAGYTTFQPSALTVPGRSTQAPFTWNVTFTDHEADIESPYDVRRREKLEKCLPTAQRSTFVGEITLYEGKSMHKGQILKGKVVVHATSGSPTMSELSVSLNSMCSDHWANQQAAAGGDSTARSHGGHKRFAQSVHNVATEYEYIFDEGYRSSYSSHHGPLTSAKPSLDFEIYIPHDTSVDFRSYYARVETALHVRLTTLYSTEITECMGPERAGYELEATLADAEVTEEDLWNAYTPVGGQPRRLYLQADTTIPLVSDAESPSFPVEHYLTPGARAPVLRAAASHVDIATFPFPTAQPVITEEPFNTTAARLLLGFSDSYHTSLENPSKFYLKYRTWGAYVGLLWRKKVVAEERGIIIPAPQSRDTTLQQQPFAAP